MGTVPPSRVVLHAMWITIVIAIWVAFLGWLAVSITHLDEAWDRRLHEGAGIVLVAPIWLPPVGLGGALIGFAAAGAHRLMRRRAPRWRLLSGALAGGLAGMAPPALFLGVQPLIWVIGVTIGMVSGGFALLLAGRSVSTTGSGWGAGAAVLAATTGVVGTFQALMAQPWDSAEDCAFRLGVDEAEVTSISRDFPPQTWCVSLSAVQQVDTSWTASAVGLMATASLVCALIVVGRWVGSTRRIPRALVVATVVTGVIGAGLSLWWPTVQPSADQLAQARAALRNQPTPEPLPSPPAAIHAAEVRNDLRRLGEIARSAAAKTVLWPKKPAITEEACALDTGASGVRVSVTATFTAKDPAEVHGPKQMAALQRANQQVADGIAAAWRTSGVLAGAEQIHGEWWFGARSIQTAHIGFTDGIGQLLLVSDCVSR